jgi:hypothetical protein
MRPSQLSFFLTIIVPSSIESIGGLYRIYDSPLLLTYLKPPIASPADQIAKPPRYSITINITSKMLRSRPTPSLQESQFL